MGFQSLSDSKLKWISILSCRLNFLSFFFLARALKISERKK